MGAMQSNQEDSQIGNWRDEFRTEDPQRKSDQKDWEDEAKKKKDPGVSEEKKQMRQEHAAKMSVLDQQLQAKKNEVKQLEEENSKKTTCNSETLQQFRAEKKELQGIRDQEAQKMRASGARILMNHIQERQDDAQEHVDKLKQLEDSQEESRKAIRQAEIELSWEFNEDNDIRAVCEASGSVTQVSVKPLYKDIGQQVSMLPRNLKPVIGAVDLAVKSKNTSFVKNKKKEAEVAFSNIYKNITVISQKGTQILKTVGIELIEQDFLTAFVKVRDEFKIVLDGILQMGILWNTDPEDEATWLNSLAGEMKNLEKHILEVTEAWKKVKIPEK